MNWTTGEIGTFIPIIVRFGLTEQLALCTTRSYGFIFDNGIFFTKEKWFCSCFCKVTFWKISGSRTIWSKVFLLPTVATNIRKARFYLLLLAELATCTCLCSETVAEMPLLLVQRIFQLAVASDMTSCHSSCLPSLVEKARSVHSEGELYPRLWSKKTPTCLSSHFSSYDQFEWRDAETY